MAIARIGNKDNREVISKKAMYRIVEMKDNQLLEVKRLLAQEEAMKEVALMNYRRLEASRKRYLILAVIATVFGVIGLVT